MVDRSHEEARESIRPLKERVEDQLIARPGVVGVDIDTKQVGGQDTGELSIVVFVRHKRPAGELPPDQLVPPSIDGVRTDVQELLVQLQPGLVVPVGVQLRAGVQPRGTIVGGISMGPERSIRLDPPDVPSPGEFHVVGTLGALVRDRATGVTMALTNYHVACVDSSWSVGDRMVHPSVVDDPEAAAPFGSLARAVLSEGVDGAVVEIDERVSWSAEIASVGDVVGHRPAGVGTAVHKSGRTTGHTFGQVVSVDFTVSLDYGGDLGERTLRHQVRVVTDRARNARFSDGGDSGSVVVDLEGNVVGLLFAGATDGSMTFANPVETVLDELGVDVLRTVAAQASAAAETRGWVR
ncbi:S1 family peptidase [Ornithinimicrobium sediminis]|uniref:S1 family peptidase n=1 Tax=Ornithinimicrobium sediminis TaxID=2904603 RepID=UPI001E38D507|nr:S1 family peptidase [Ornithinimicrobium sediminis]MCE0486567.1 S1 family peptidase [Ornithinimicrobium sediminis]